MKGSDRGQFGHDDADDLGGSALDAYLDGRLGAAERSAFEAHLARDPALAGARDAQRRIDNGLRGLFVVPPFIPLPMNGHPTGGTNGHPTNGHPAAPPAQAASGTSAAHGWAGVKSAIVSTKGLLAGLALLAALLGGGGWLAYLHFTAPAENPQLTFAELYQQQIHATAATPNGTVQPSQLESLSSQTIGYTIRMKKHSANVKLVSMAQAHVLSSRTFVLQARYEGSDVLLLADRACEDLPATAAAESCGIHQFRREVGGVVFYELTPLDKPVLLNAYDVLPAASTSGNHPTATQPTTP